MTILSKLFTVEDLERLYELPENADKMFELIEGVIYDVTSGIVLHAYVVNRFAYILTQYAETTGLGYAFGDGCGYRLSDINLLIPDASFMSKARYSDATFPKYFTFAPDVAVEVLSPSNTRKEIMTKVRLYLQHGGQLVWVASPDEQTIEVYQLDAEGELTQQRLTIADTLTAPDVLEGFAVAVKRFFFSA